MMLVGIAGALLLLLAAVRLAGGSRARRVVVLFAAGLCVAVLANHVLTPRMGLVPDTEASRVVKHARLQMLEALADPGTQLIVVVNGASLTARGVDGDLLSDQLRRKMEVQVAVVQLSIAGANHLERQAMARMLVADLPPRLHARLVQVPLVVLWEVHRGYDMDILAEFDENQDTARTYAYLDAAGLVSWAKAMLAEEREEQRRASMRLLPDILRHVVISVLRVGSGKWMVDEGDLSPMHGFRPKRGPGERERVVGLSNNVERIAGLRTAPAPAYVDDVLSPAYLQAFGHADPQLVYFSPPSRSTTHLAYVHRFCVEHPDRVCIGYRNRALLKRLDHRRYWADGSHLAPSGAATYTRWLAEVLAKAMIRHDMARENGDYG